MIFNTNIDEMNLKKILKKEEKHKESTISFYELFLMCLDRYILIENELSDLKRLFKHHFNINNMVFQENLNSDVVLMIDFYDDKKEYIIINVDEMDTINIVLDTTNGKYDKLINYAKSMILDAFKKENKLFVSRNFLLNSSSKIFNIRSLSNELDLSLNSRKMDNYFKLNYNFNNKLNYDNLLKYFECKTNLLNIEREISDLEKLKKFLDNVMINEKDVPSMLLQKK